MAQLGTYYEAFCGECNKFLYGTTTGDYLPSVVCPKCGETNLFSDSTGLSEARILGRLATDASCDNDRIHAAPSDGPTH